MNLTYEEMMEFDGEYNYVPICKEIYGDDITPITLLKKISVKDDRFFLLESVEGGERWGRYSFLGFKPQLQISCKAKKVILSRDGIKTSINQNPMDAIRDILKEYKAPRVKELPPFTGGFVGYFSYEMIGYEEPKLNLKENEFNDYDLMLFDKVIAYDHLKQKIVVIVNVNIKDGELAYKKALLEIDHLIQIIHEYMPRRKKEQMEVPEFKCNVSKEEFIKMVEKTKRYIHEGDIFQGVISRKFVADYNSSLMNTYRILRTTNPSPYMYFIKCADVEIAGASPETMVKLLDSKITTFPVAGTRPRGKNKEEDIKLEMELLEDKKELAEHNMLVDLARNDVGRVAKMGSVEVTEYMKIHRFSKVMHIASTVNGTILDGKDGCDTIRALLPAGTLSGAPKFRACEIIDELEKEPRGIYGGAIGYLDLSGNLDVCIAIRTAIKKGNKVYVQAGAGIVLDSVAVNEYEECANKASAVMEAVKRAGEVMEE